MSDKRKKELWFSIIGGIFLLFGFILEQFDFLAPHYIIAIYSFAYFFGGFYMMLELIQTVRKRKFDIDLLMFLAAVGAAVLDKWAEGGLLLFLFSLGHSLEHYALERANQSIAALAKITPKTALVKRKDAIIEVPIEELSVGDIVLIKPNTRIAADGFIINGNSTVDQSAITGESIPVRKISANSYDPLKNQHDIPDKNRVYSGTLNHQGYLEVIVLKNSDETTLAKLIKMVQEAKNNKSYAQQFTQKFEKIFVPLVLGFICLLLFAFLVIDEPFSTSFYRAMTVLVVASPCALVISTPSAVLCGIAKAARIGVLIKGGKPLISLGLINTFAFDKTGTLTKGKPVVTEFIPFNEGEKEILLPKILAIEQRSNHPLAKSIVDYGRQVIPVVSMPEIMGFREVVGCGVKGWIEGVEFAIGNRELFIGASGAIIPDDILTRMKDMELQGQTTILVREGNQFKALIGMMDVPRPENTQVISALKDLGISHVLMLSGDDDKVANAVGKKLGIEEVIGNLLPEDKVRVIKSLVTERKKVAMVGDGVNDAPAMANSNLGIAMGAAGSDVALETADIALMAENLSSLPQAIRLSKKTRTIIRQNIFISLGVIALMIPLAIFGLTTMGPAVLIHEGSTVAVVINALRILK